MRESVGLVLEKLEIIKDASCDCRALLQPMLQDLNKLIPVKKCVNGLKDLHKVTTAADNKCTVSHLPCICRDGRRRRRGQPRGPAASSGY